MPPLIDLTGRKFGRLTVRCRAGTDQHGKVKWLCDCSCGVKGVVALGMLLTREGRPTRSCGCLRRETASKALKVGRRSDAHESKTWQRACRHCGVVFAARRGEWYHSEACYTASRAVKRREMRNKPKFAAARLAAELGRRMSDGEK